MSGGILLTQQSGFLKPIVVVLGYLMDWIFIFLDKLSIPNIGLAIILFTIVIYTLMTPLTYKQQKFSKLSAKMNPELQAVQKKYKNKKDNDSMMAMNQETQAVYAKYGVSPTGSCLQLLIQMPILFSLYRVIYAMPAYVTKLGDAMGVLADKIVAKDGGQFLQNSGIDSISKIVSQYSKNFTIEGNTKNAIIDVLNKVSSNDMATLATRYNLSDLTFNGEKILGNQGLLHTYNNFLGLNISNSPSAIILDSFKSGQYILLIAAVMIPVLAALTQWLNVKLMPQPSTGNGENGQADTVANSMKTMNMMMPIMSAFFCLTLPAGMGLYWVIGAVVRSIQQVLINKHIDKIDMDEVIRKNVEKREKKLEKMGISANTINKNASLKTRTVVNSSVSQNEKDEALKKASEYYSKNAKPGSIAAKANMVRDFNQNNKQGE